MGRKIPGRKHRGVRDPEKQQEARLAKIKDKINAAPSHPDEQQIPSSLSRLMELKNKVKEGFYNRKKKPKAVEQDVTKKFKGKPYKTIPKFEQRPDESDKHFKQRVNKICADYLREAAFEDKYNVNVKRNSQGEVEGVEKRPKDELELLVKKIKKEKKKNKNKKKGKKEGESEVKMTKSQKWSIKKSEKKKKKLAEKNDDYRLEPQMDHVKFGETAHAPPTLVAPRKVEKLNGAPRPGQKQLLLKTILETGSKNSDRKEKASNLIGVSKKSKSIDKKGKRKDLPSAMRRQLEKQQKEVIAAYKLLKSKKSDGK